MLAQYALRRILLAIPTVWLAATLVFIIVRLLPGDPALLMVGDAQDAQALELARRDMGLDQSLPTQYVLWLSSMASFELGESIAMGLPVRELIWARFLVTAQLAIPSILLALLIAVPLGLFAAAQHNKAVDRAAMLSSVVLLSVPSFWVALLLIMLFGVKLNWLPTVGYVSPAVNLTLAIQFALMPVLALSLTVIGQLTRMTRSTALDVLATDYVLFARAKGLSETTTLLRHVLPNAVAPTLTVAGMIFGSLLGGAAVIETIFTIPGIGRLLVDSIYARDYPVIQGAVLFVGFLYILVNMLVDLVYPLLDPRIRLQ